MGGLQRVAPDEVRIAYFRAMAQAARDHNEAVAAGPTPAAIEDLAENIKQWRHLP